ncbi:hypothetical protein GA830_13075 [Mesorhizobium sp. NBSH29]|uniref:hypothetical protein n=1 Tax=Mesorhizobium sp. NBSH29 TaxID=2654249 RepID=UPI0018966C9C|nr:hypothetical protein [Mesorhizobium sp. NBSH29]QPC87577.1 hypothetical protein GA830_13075 [Mesorhizobium sp. NBSH29]
MEFPLRYLGGNRAIDYHPTLVVRCEAGGGWSETIKLRAFIAGSAAVPVSVQIDARIHKQTWSLTDRNSTLVYIGQGSGNRLAGARKFKVSWRSGYFGGNEAIFGLDGIDAVLAFLKAACTEPR